MNMNSRIRPTLKNVNNLWRLILHKIGVVANRVHEIVARLRERGHRLTPQRYAVVRAVMKCGENPSAEQSRATVYKTLDIWEAGEGD